MLKYISLCITLILLMVLSEQCLGICWDTGCQQSSWAVTGCAQYNMHEAGKRSCVGGSIFSCCSKNRVESSSTGNPGATKKQSSEGHLVARNVCWDTGCQLNSWASTGCAQYGMVETGRRSCVGGTIFTCCNRDVQQQSDWVFRDKFSSYDVKLTNNGNWNHQLETNWPNPGRHSLNTAVLQSSNNVCWDTSCQPSKHPMIGCGKNLIETWRRPCEGGVIFACCTSQQKVFSPGTTTAGRNNHQKPPTRNQQGTLSNESSSRDDPENHRLTDRLTFGSASAKTKFLGSNHGSYPWNRQQVASNLNDPVVYFHSFQGTTAT